jgi:hypothetical protein
VDLIDQLVVFEGAEIQIVVGIAHGSPAERTVRKRAKIAHHPVEFQLSQVCCPTDKMPEWLTNRALTGCFECSDARRRTLVENFQQFSRARLARVLVSGNSTSRIEDFNCRSRECRAIVRPSSVVALP